MAQYYPIYLDITGCLCVVIGGGHVSARKTAGLLEAGARVRVVSPVIVPELLSLVNDDRIEFIASHYESAHLDGASLVFAATNMRDVNAQVTRDAGALCIPVNAADAPTEGNFIVPAVIRRGDFCLSISTGGNNPLLAARLHEEFERRFGTEYGGFVELLGDMRNAIKFRTEDTSERRRALSFLLDNEQEIRELIALGRADEASSLARSLVDSALSPRSVE